MHAWCGKDCCWVCQRALRRFVARVAHLFVMIHSDEALREANNAD